MFELILIIFYIENYVIYRGKKLFKSIRNFHDQNILLQLYMLSQSTRMSKYIFRK